MSFPPANLYLGIMSGTSLDGVDIALMDFSQPQAKLVASDCFPIPKDLRQQLSKLLRSGETTLQQLGELDHRLGLLYANCINQFLQQQKRQPREITAIGCHGQTIWHSPNGKYPFTMQIGDANLIAANTKITTIADFRRKDMAVGGQGAPLVPAFHQGLFADPKRITTVLNIGGISNVSLLIPNQPVIGYDIGAGNTLMDCWIEKHQGKAYDENARWAKTGKVNTVLLSALLSEPFLRLPPPKSTGRELFNLAWLEAILKKTQNKSPALLPEDVQATLAEFTLQSIVQALQGIENPNQYPCLLLVCGGGAKNPLLMQGFSRLLTNWQVATTSEYGLDVDYVEAAAFAWLAYQRIHNRPSNLPSVTGASRPVSLGVIYPKES